MKKLYHTLYGRLCALLLLFIIAFIVHSCRKQVAELPDANAINTISAEIKVWLAAQKADSIAVNDILKQANWPTAHSVQTDSLTFLAVKLTIDPQKFDDPNKKVDRYLVIVKSKGVVKDGYLYDVFGDAAQISQNADQYITNYNKNFSIAFTGNLTKLTLRTGLKETEVYNSGELGTRKVVVARKHNSGLVIQSKQKTNDDLWECIDWYLITYNWGVEVSEEYLITLCDCDGPSQTEAVRDHLGVMSVFLKPRCSGGDGGSTPTPPPDSVLKWKFCDNLTAAQKASINASISTFSNNDCPSKFLYNYLVNTLGIKYSFCVGTNPTPNYSFNYNPDTKAFTYATNDMTAPVMSYGLEHEFFHALQDALIGISGYGKNASTGVNSPGFVDIEFEQAVFNDIANGSYQAFKDGTDQQKQDYQDWINILTQNGTVYPKFDSSNTNSFISQYNSFLSDYNQISGNINSSTILNLSPSTLIYLFNQTNPNC